MTTPDESIEAAERLFSTVQNGELEDLHRIFADGAQVWHNTDDAFTDIPTTIANLRKIRDSACLFEYRDIRRSPTPEGFVQQHTLVIEMPDGRRIKDFCCCVCTVEGGRIEQMDGYHDLRRQGLWRTSPDKTGRKAASTGSSIVFGKVRLGRRVIVLVCFGILSAGAAHQGLPRRTNVRCHDRGCPRRIARGKRIGELEVLC